jgi:hypothetical protein
VRLVEVLPAPAKKANGGLGLGGVFWAGKACFLAAEGEGGSARAGPVAAGIRWFEVALFKPSHRRGIGRYWPEQDRGLWGLFGRWFCLVDLRVEVEITPVSS